MVCLSPGVPSAGVLMVAEDGVEACIALVSNRTSRATAGRKRADTFILLSSVKGEIFVADGNGPRGRGRRRQCVTEGSFKGAEAFRTDSRAATTLPETHQLPS